MSSSPAGNERELLENDGGDSSRESGIGDPTNGAEVEEVPEELVESHVNQDDDEDEGCAPNQSFGTESVEGSGSKEDGGAFSLAWASTRDGGDDDEESKSKEDVKKITGFDKGVIQERRRQETLQWQRQRRDEMLDKIRQLEDSAYSDSEDEMDFAESVRRTAGPPQHQTLEEIFEESGADVIAPEREVMEVAVPKSKSGRSKKKNRQSKGTNKMDTGTPSQPQYQHYNQQYQHQQSAYTHPQHYDRRPQYREAPCRPMLSEWLLEKPADFEEMWLGVVCPVGKRVIVLASRGKTKIFSRRDEYLGSYKSLLPGGCRYNYRDSTTNRNRGVTILDCIWSQETQTFYVLDLLCWNSHSCVNCDTDYRQFFLTSKFSENMELLERSPSNPFPFKPLPYFPASEMQLVLWSTIAFPESVDGILVFHKESFYISETNPLCLWILLTQCESILGISVSPDLLARQVKCKNMSSRKKQQQLKKAAQAQLQNQEMDVALG